MKNFYFDVGVEIFLGLLLIHHDVRDVVSENQSSAQRTFYAQPFAHQVEFTMVPAFHYVHTITTKTMATGKDSPLERNKRCIAFIWHISSNLEREKTERELQREREREL